MLCSIITYSCGALYFTYSIIIGLNLFHVRKEGEKKKKKGTERRFEWVEDKMGNLTNFKWV